MNVLITAAAAKLGRAILDQQAQTDLQAQADREAQALRQAQVWACLEGVTDPELDESVVELNFISKAEVDPMNRVHIEFRLPTYWCAANFAFLMADDMHRAVSALAWVQGVSVVLGEHMYADKINAGLAQGLSFQDTFGAEADDGLDELRRTFLVKAFQRRQVALLNHLTASGHPPEAIVSLTLAQLAALSLGTDGDQLRRRYLERRHVVDANRPDAPAFIDAGGAPLRADRLAGYVSALRRVGVNAEFNSALCRGLLSVRFDLDTPFVPPSTAAANPQPRRG
jgi:metal-sulfur cluster biosynthetic enzyme